jgi:hypothetical protein
MEDKKVLAESLSAEAAQAAAIHAEAIEKSREAQMESVVERVLVKVLTDTDGSPMLIKRVPFICLDIVWIKKLLWAILAANGAVLLGIITLAIQRAFA